MCSISVYINTMLKYFCQVCGQSTEYTLSKPKFCANCSHPFESQGSSASTTKPKPTIATARQKPSVRPPPPEPENNLESDDDNIEVLPELDITDVVIVPTKTNKITIGQLAAEHKLGLEARPKRKMNKKQFQEEWLKEAGTRRNDTPPTEVGGGE